MDKTVIDVAAVEQKASHMFAKGIESAILFRRGVVPKQVKYLSDSFGSVQVALFTSHNTPTSGGYGAERVTHQSIWIWDGVGVLSLASIPSYQVMEEWDQEERMQQMFDAFTCPKDVWSAMKRNGKKLPAHIKV